MMKYPLRIAVVLLVGLLFLPGAAFGLAPAKKAPKPRKQPPRQEQGEKRRAGQGDLGRFTENLPPQLRDAIHRLWDRMPPQARDRIQQRMGQMRPEQRQELMQRFSSRMQQRGGRPDQGRRPERRQDGPQARREGPGRRPDARNARPQARPEGRDRLAQAMREHLQSLSPEQRERVQKALQGMSPERRQQILEHARRMGRRPDAAGPQRPGPGREGARNVPGRHQPPTAAGRPGQGGVAEERVKNMIKGEISKLPMDVRQRIHEALGHLPPERRAEVLARALSEESGGGRPQNARPDQRREGARPGGPRQDGGPGKAKPGRKGERGDQARKPNRPAPGGRRGDANRPPRRGNVERLIRSGISALPEPVRKQVEDRFGRMLPRLSEGRERGNVLHNFREALQRRFQSLSPGDRSKVMDWYRGDARERSI